MQIPTKEGSIKGSRIIEVGKGPWQVERARGEIAVRNRSLVKAKVLDANGVPIADLPVVRDGDRIQLRLPEDALYLCLQSGD